MKGPSAKFANVDLVVVVGVGAVFGAITAIVGELFSRFCLIRGDTHIDAPASAI